MGTNKVYEVALGMIPGIGGTLTKILVSYCGSPEKIFQTPKGKLLKIPGIGEVLADSIIKSRNLICEAEKQLQKAEAKGVEILFYTDPMFPDRLRQIQDSPALLFYKGNASLNHKRTVGIVGTRQATEYGKETVRMIVEGLSKYQPLIVSGLAFGIDIAAHKAALHYNLPTIGAMATGIDTIYPALHKETANKMTGFGGLITEYHIGSKADPSKFPARNRIIAGLCDVLIVVEAAEKGGALITAEMANEYNREVFAVPGNVGNKYSEGCNKLIQKHKAHIFDSVQSFEYIMNWPISESEEVAKKDINVPEIPGLATEEQAVVTILAGCEGIQVDDLSWKSNIPLSKLASILLNLEFKGVVKNMPGKKYKLVKS